MIEAWSACDVRSAEEPHLAAGEPLMAHAAFALARAVAQELADAGTHVAGARVVLLVGPGNNGGDTLFAGAHLARRGAMVRALLTHKAVHREGLAALRAAYGRTVDLGAGTASPGWQDAVMRAVSADVILDGLLGIGAKGALRGVPEELVTAINAALADAAVEPAMPAPHASPVSAPTPPAAKLHEPAQPAQRRRPRMIAVDTPSGIGVDDGAVRGPVLAADRTVTFGAAKPGLLLPPGAHKTGRLDVVHIGLDFDGHAPAVRSLEPADVAAMWPVPGPTDHKYTRGVLGVVAGTASFPGAAVLAVSAAVRTGPGMVRYRGPQPVTDVVLAARPEVVPASGQVQAWTLGCGVPPDGLGETVVDDGQHQRIRHSLAMARGDFAADVVGRQVPAVADAGALSLLPSELPPHVVLTPHAGELASLLRRRGEDVLRADVEAEPLRWARRAHELTGATVLIKGAVTVVVGPGVVYAQHGAPAWMATAGAGDVLAGILGAMLAMFSAQVVAEPALAAKVAAAAVVVHSLAGSRVNPGGPVAALDVADAVPAVIAGLLARR